MKKLDNVYSSFLMKGQTTIVGKFMKTGRQSSLALCYLYLLYFIIGYCEIYRKRRGMQLASGTAWNLHTIWDSVDHSGI